MQNQPTHTVKQKQNNRAAAVTTNERTNEQTDGDGDERSHPLERVCVCMYVWCIYVGCRRTNERTNETTGFQIPIPIQLKFKFQTTDDKRQPLFFFFFFSHARGRTDRRTDGRTDMLFIFIFIFIYFILFAGLPVLDLDSWTPGGAKTVMGGKVR